MRGLGWNYFASTPGLPLSLKCASNGRARYRVAGREFTVDDGGWLIVNDGQPYSIEIDSPTLVETFIVWFPRGWADEVLRSATTSSVRLLAEPETADSASVDFFECYTSNETSVAPALRTLRAAHRRARPLDDSWLEEKLRGLLARMIAGQRDLRRAVSRLPALRLETREELWRRLNRARDFIHARCDTPLTLSDAARAAAMSPYHFLRAFKTAFGLTPHNWLTTCRVERAKFLLARTELPVVEICHAIGYEGLGSFSAWFSRHAGLSPRSWRCRHGARRAIRNFREDFFPSDLLNSAAKS